MANLERQNSPPLISQINLDPKKMDFSCTSHHLSLLPLFKNLPWKFVHYGICETKFWEIGKGYEKASISIHISKCFQSSTVYFCNSFHSSWWLEKYTLNFNAIPIKDSADDKSPVVSVPHSLAKKFP